MTSYLLLFCSLIFSNSSYSQQHGDQLKAVPANASFATDSVNLLWNPNPEPEIVGYKLYYKTRSSKDWTIINTGNTTAITLENLENDKEYEIFLIAVSYSEAHNLTLESPKTDSIFYNSRPYNPDTPPASIKDIVMVEVDTDGDGIVDSKRFSFNFYGGQVGQTFTIESTTNLKDWISDPSTNFEVGAEGQVIPVEVDWPIVGGAPMRFWRVKTVSP